MSRTKSRWRLSPLFVTGTTTCLVILFVLTLNWLAARRNRLTARVEIAAPVVEAAQEKTKASSSTQSLPDGEVERTALRVREASALVTGLTLFAVNEGLQRRPVNRVESLLEKFITGGLLPPGIERHETSGVLTSHHATLYLRYRPEPLAIEIISLGHDERDGPAIIARIITGKEEAAGASLLLARQLSNVALPAPFTPNAEIAALNWSVEPLRERNFTEPELAQLNAWLRTQSAH